MNKVRIEIYYIDEVKRIAVNGIEIKDLTPIAGKAIRDWFLPSEGRDGWEGLLFEVRKLIDDASAELCFEFAGPSEEKHIFEECLTDLGLGNESARLSSEEISRRNLEEAQRAEHRGLRPQAFEFYLKAADYGNSAEAQYKVGQYYYSHFKGEQLYGDISKERAITRAVEYFEKAAGQGHPDAAYRLYELFSVKKNQEEAFSWLSKATNSDSASSPEIPITPLPLEKIAEAINLNADRFRTYKRAADRGYAGAQVVLGFCYESGIRPISFVEETERALQKQKHVLTIKEGNHRQAFEYYRKAAEQKYVCAQYRMGRCYEYGIGIKKDFTAAAKWYGFAANQNYAPAQYSLGFYYEHGMGIKRDLAKAIELYQEAASQNYALAQYRLGCCYEHGMGTKEALARAAELYQKAAIQNCVPAQYKLGHCCEFGKGMEQDLFEAVKWYQKAAEQDCVKAQCDLGHCYEVLKQYESAIECYNGAIKNGSTRAMYLLGRCYAHGINGKKDLKTAYSLYKRAADDRKANADACFEVGNMYEASYVSNSGSIRQKLVLLSASIINEESLKEVRRNKFKKSKAGKEMIKYYYKAAKLGHEEAKKKLKYWG